MKKTFRKNRLYILLNIVLGIFIATGIIYKYTRPAKTVKAFGNLIIDFGVPEGEAIFDFDDFKPGDCALHEIKAENSGDETVEVVMKTVDTTNPDALSDVLKVVITENGNDLYGGSLGEKSLTDLFNDSADGIVLSNLAGGQTTTYEIKICFDFGAGNEYQKTKVVFDIIFETRTPPIELPPECEHLAGIITKVVEGTEGNDRLHGSTASELILAYGGNDRVDPSSGSDCVVLGDGNDFVQGTTGNEVILGGPGNDKLEGGSGNDIIYGGPGNDKIDGGTDNDVLYGEEGNDTFDAGSGDDIVYGGPGNDTIKVGSGDDKVYAGPGDDNMRGGSGNDLLDGEADHDEAKGDGGTDTCIAEVKNSCEL